MGKIKFKKLFFVFATGLWVHGPVGSLRAESAFWDERRARSVRQRSLPERSGRLHVAALPTPHRIKLASPDSVDARSVGNPLGFSLPLECGSVRKIMPPRASPSSRVVIHILDVHHNEAAQRKIGSAIESLVSNRSIGLVALEGAYGPIEIEGLRRFSRPDILRTAADYLLRVHDISGPVHSAITGNQAFPPIVGVDDPAHYRANVTAYQRAGPHQGDVQEALKRVQTDLDRRCAAGMNQPLLTFVRLTQSFHNEITPLGTYLRALLSDAPKKAVGSSLVWFQEAMDLEGRLDFKQVEREREALLGVLLRRLNAGEIEKLTQKSTAYRLGKIRYSEFYRDLGALCAQNGVDLHRFPHMEMYIRYVLMADKIDPEILFTDLRTLENAILARRIKSLSERRLVEETTVLTLAKKLTAFSLTTEEWNQYASSGKDFLSQEGLNLQDFEAFYQEAQARDTAMADNLLREMENNPSKPAVLVTGGFHSSGLTDRLTRAGVTVVRFTPRIEKIDTAQGSAYLSVFSQEKTPLESLFQGQKLFLATSPANVEKLSFLAAITGAAKEKDPSARKRIFAHLYSEAAGLLGFNDIKRALPEMKVIESAGQRKTLRVHWKGKSYEVSFANDKIVDFHPGSTTSDNMWRPVIAFLKKLAGMILRWIPLAVVADHENGLPNVDLTESGRPGFAKEKLLSSFYGTRDKLIKRGRPDGKPYFPYLYESRDREVGIEADGIKIVLVDVAERADYDKPRRLSEFARHSRDIREGHPDDKCVFCRLMGANSDEFFARVQGTGRNEYRATVNLGEYGYPHFQFISENPVPNLYDRDNRLMDFLLSAQALGPELGVMINGPFSGASQRHLHWHAIKIKPGGLWAYIDSLSPPTESGPSMREELANYPGRPILFRGSSLEELNEKITKEITALYDDQISAGVHARVRTDGTFEVVVAPTRGEAMVAFDVIFHGSDEEFERHRTAVRNYNLFGILDPTFDPIAEGMGATHTPGSAPNILMKLPEDFKANNEWQARTAKRLIQVFGDYNPKKDMDRAVARFNQILEAAWGSETPTEVPGAKQLLSALSDSNIPLYIASGAPEEIIERGLDALKMDQIPPENRFGAPRPKSETIAQAKQRTDGVVIMFGDGELDMTEAKKVEGVIGIQRKDSTSSHPTFNSANYVVADYSQVEWKALDGTISFPDQKSGQRVNLSGVGAVVFDFDGTLVASEGLVGGVFARFVREYFGLPDNDTTAGQIAVDVWRSMDGRSAEEILPVLISTLEGMGYARPPLDQIMRQTALANLGQRLPGVPLHTVDPVIDEKEAGLRGAASFVEPSIPTLTTSMQQRTPDHLVPLESNTTMNDLTAASLTERPFPQNPHREGVERSFGKTGLSFLPMGLGTIWFGRRWPNNNQAWTDPSQTEVDQAIWRAFEQLSNKDGRVMIDTAAAYGKSEERIGDFFHRYPAYARLAFIATKWGEEHHLSTGQSQYDHSAESLRTSFERSLARLGRVDLLYVHGTPGQIVDEEAKKAMMALRTSGKVKLLGVSLSHRHPKARDTILLRDWEGVFDVVQMPANMFIENREFVQALKARGIAIVLNSALPAHPELLHNSDVSMILNGSRFHFDENASLLNQPSLPKSGALAQTPLTKTVWKNVARLFKVSPRYKYSKHVEFAFTALWEFFLHWAAPFFVVSWLFAHFGLSFPDMWLIPVLAVILEPVFVGSHPFSVQGKDLTRLAHFLMSFYGAGGFLIAWGGRGPALGVVFIIVGLAVHFFHDFFRAPPSSSDEENIERKNANEVTNHPETVLRSVLARKIESTDLLRRQGLEHSVQHSIDGGPVPAGESRLSLPEPVDAQLRNATARFAFLAGLDEVAVRDRSAVKSKHTLLSLLDAYAKAGEGWKGNLSQVVNDENAGVWVVPVGSDWKSMGALARACLSSRGRHTEIRFIAENEAVALALRFWSLGRGRVQVRTVPKAFSPGSGNHRIVRLFAVQQSLARDVVLRSGTAWRIVAPDSIAMDYSGLAENSPLWNAPVVFLDALLRALPVPASSLRNLDSAASRLIKRMA